MDMETGFNAMGKPVPELRKQAAYDTAKAIGVESFDDRMTLISTMANYLERDRPFEAQQSALRFVDLTGAYRLMAVLLTG